MECLAQAVQFAHGIGKEVFPEPEAHTLSDMYEDRAHSITISEFVQQVCLAFSSICLRDPTNNLPN
jgi:hypothetical protein